MDATEQTLRETAERRHRALREASAAALASPEFRSVIDGMKERAAAQRRQFPVTASDAQADHDHESREGWANEKIGNAYA